MLKTDRRFQLRENTKRAHAAVESAVGGFETLSDYQRYLTGIAAFRLPLEAALSAARWPAIFGTWRPHSIGQALRDDLESLHLLVVESDTGWLDNQEKSTEWLLGVSYVLEGSSLGAKILHQRALALGLDESFGAKHLGLQTSAMTNWREFLNLLEQDNGLDIDKIVAAANDAFDAAGRAFQHHALYPALRADDAQQQLG